MLLTDNSYEETVNFYRLFLLILFTLLIKYIKI